MLMVILDWVTQVNSLLSLDKDDRVQAINDFLAAKKSELSRTHNNTQSLAIDHHRDAWKEWTNNTFHTRLFTTHSHRLLENICLCLHKIVDAQPQKAIVNAV